jgi:hypothetical protein
MDQEVSHLYALFGGPEEDEVRVKGQRLAKAWMKKAIDRGPENTLGCGLEESLSSTDRGNVTTRGRPWRVGPARFKHGPPLDELTGPGGRDPGASRGSAVG